MSCGLGTCQMLCLSAGEAQGFSLDSNLHSCVKFPCQSVFVFRRGTGIRQHFIMRGLCSDRNVDASGSICSCSGQDCILGFQEMYDFQ